MEIQDDPMGEEIVNLWEAEDPPDDIEDPVLPKVQSLHRIPGCCMRLALSVQEKRTVNSSRTPQEKK